MLRLCGADLRLVPAAPYKDPNNYVKVSGRLAAALDASEPNGAVWANQFDNTANRQAHIEGTGPEIWEQTGGRIDGFTCAIGTGGTLAGIAFALKERNPDVQVWASDPLGASMVSLLAPGKPVVEGESITEGIGQGRITANVEARPSTTPSRSPMSKPSRRYSLSPPGRASSWAAPPASTSPAR